MVSFSFKALLCNAVAAAAACVCATPSLAASGMQGLWCGRTAIGSASLLIKQQDQDVKIELQALGRKRDYEGRVEGKIATVPTSHGETAMAFELQGDRLRIVDTRESLAMLKGEAFTRAAGNSCPAG